MRLLIDTHIFIGLTRGTLKVAEPALYRLVMRPEASLYLSVASIWEITIKHRLGKLDAGLNPEELEDFCRDSDIEVVPILASHATAQVIPEPPTRDPFDRLLLAQCKVEGYQLVTIDRALINHPYSFMAI
jgi:PIN domain nuclease of toxin-antitoxin system